MAKKIITAIPTQAQRGPGRPTRYGVSMESQVTVGLDERRQDQLQRLKTMLEATSAGNVSLADVMRMGLDMLATSMLGEVNEQR